jgi:hypothetical protein
MPICCFTLGSPTAPELANLSAWFVRFEIYARLEIEAASLPTYDCTSFMHCSRSREWIRELFRSSWPNSVLEGVPDRTKSGGSSRRSFHQ